MKSSTDGKLTTFMQPSGYANGMRFDRTGHLSPRADEKNEMWTIDVATKKATVLFRTTTASCSTGRTTSGCSRRPGRIYFTDPFYQRK